MNNLFYQYSNSPINLLFSFDIGCLFDLVCIVGSVFEFGLLDFLIAYAIREMYNYTVDTLDTHM